MSITVDPRPHMGAQSVEQLAATADAATRGGRPVRAILCARLPGVPMSITFNPQPPVGAERVGLAATEDAAPQRGTPVRTTGLTGPFSRPEGSP
jgi:hypothetical protein